jgi:hypothetical protein
MSTFNVPIPPRIPGDAVLKTLDVELAKVEELIGDAVSQNGYKGAVKVATTANITLSGAQTIDGVAVVGGDKVLVKNQISGANNGIYDVKNNTNWTRSEVMVDGSSAAGAVVYVTQGTTNADVWFICTNDVGSDVVGTNALVFATIGTGNVVGPASATDNALVRFDGTTGKLIQNSAAILDDSGNMTSVNTLTTTGFVAAGTNVVGGTGVIATTGNVVATVGNVTATGTTSSTVSGSIVTAQVLLLCGAGQANTATLVLGTVTVTVPVSIGLTANDIILVTRNTLGGAVGDLSVPVASYNTGAGSFVINSDSVLDTSTVNWFLCRQF